MKSEALLEAKASAAVADAAAFIFIDAIDPIGTLNPLVYERMGRIFDRLLPYYPHLGGQRVRDVAIFSSLESKFNMATNGRGPDMVDLSDAHTASSMQVGRRLIAAHVPFGVVTKQSLNRLDGVKLLVLSNPMAMDEEETSAIRAWVQNGGTLLASGPVGLIDKRGHLQKDFPLGDVLGVTLETVDWSGSERYVAPTAAGEKLFENFSAKYPAFVTTPGMTVRAAPAPRCWPRPPCPGPRRIPRGFPAFTRTRPGNRPIGPRSCSIALAAAARSIPPACWKTSKA